MKKPTPKTKRDYSRGYSAGLRNKPFTEIENTNSNTVRGWQAAQTRYLRETYQSK